MAATVKDADCVLVTVRLDGWLVIAGGTMTVSVALLVTEPSELLATQE